MRCSQRFWILITLTLTFFVPVQAQVPGQINFQGNLSQGGTPFSGAANITFNIYDVASGGTSLWTEAHTGVTVTNGVFDVLLGSVTPFAADLFSTGPRFLGVMVEGESEMTPRLPFASTPFSLRAGEADDVADGAVTSAKIAANAIGSGKIADGAVTNAKIAANAIGSGKIADGQVQSVDLAAGAVTADKLDPMGAAAGQVLKWDGSAWAPEEDNEGAGGAGDITAVTAERGLVGGGTEGAVALGIGDGGVTADKLNQMGAGSGEVLKWNGTSWAPGVDSEGVGSGIAFVSAPQTVFRPADDNVVVAQLTLEAPAAGFVVFEAFGYLGFAHDTGTGSRASVGVYDSADPPSNFTPGVAWVSIPSNLPSSGFYFYPVSSQTAIRTAGPASVTGFLVARQQSGNLADIRSVRLQATFHPASYGPTSKMQKVVEAEEATVAAGAQ